MFKITFVTHQHKIVVMYTQVILSYSVFLNAALMLVAIMKTVLNYFKSCKSYGKFIECMLYLNRLNKNF